ncbi:hypothetical protein KUTeg_006324 [Tegillarca granosa]|uniref:Ig-like domain-containing protein n=1 Tax=Tegillarca granosa TaxID=220873 RepID=A0ABQ9FG89_TEGGR|nr:hypothetical protein KUTeg_006324 [Tegillarca granosa]
MRRLYKNKMDYFKISYTLFFTVTILVQDIFSLTVSMNQNPVGNLESEVDIVCSYVPQPSDIVTTINLEKRMSGDNFEQIATFFSPILNQNATFANTTIGKDLAKRAELTNPATNNMVAGLKINTVQCGDEATYRCLVSHVAAGITLVAKTTNNLTVKGRAKSPDTVPIMNPAENIVENTDVFFTCTGDVGKPAGTFIWQKYKNNNPVGLQMSGDATTQPIDGTCTVNKTNEVDKPIIQRDPPSSDILAGKKVTLTCSANGHPTPTYAWYDGNNNKLKDGPTYEIQNAQVSDSGAYKCTASNTYPFNGLTFNQTSSALVNIGGGLPTGGLIAIIVVVVLIFVVVAVVLLVCLLRRNKRNRNEIDEPPEKPRNNQDLSFVNRPDIVGNDHSNKLSPFNNQFSNNKERELYNSLQFDDRPRSRKPIQLYDPGQGQDCLLDMVFCVRCFPENLALTENK